MTIPFWRNVSIVLLAAEAFILTLFPLVAFYFANRGLRRLRSFLRPIFPQTRARVQQVERVTALSSELIVAPIIAAYALAARLQRIVLVMVGLPRRRVFRD